MHLILPVQIRNKCTRLWQLKWAQSVICDLKYFLRSLRLLQPSTSALKSLILPLLLQQLHEFHLLYQYVFIFLPSRFPNTFLADNWTAYKSSLLKQLYRVLHPVSPGPYLILENELYCRSHYIVNASKWCLRELGYPSKSPLFCSSFLAWVLLIFECCSWSQESSKVFEKHEINSVQWVGNCSRSSVRCLCLDCLN